MGIGLRGKQYQKHTFAPDGPEIFHLLSIVPTLIYVRVYSRQLALHTYRTFPDGCPPQTAGMTMYGINILFHRLLCDRVNTFGMIRFDVVHFGDSL